jgi:stearoyl-CoA desaturase (delta-9 desaturase)
MSAVSLLGVQAVDARPRAICDLPEPAAESLCEFGEVPRMRPVTAGTNPCDGVVVWSPVKSLWFTAHALTAVVGGALTFQWEAAAFSAALTVFTLCLGHTIGLHRLLIHRSFECPRWLEYSLVHLGTVVGMGGPFRMLYLHDIRDWSQRQRACHPFFINQRPFWRDLLWQLHCEVRLAHPPRFVIEPRVASDPVYRLLQTTWMLQQAPWGALCYLIGGWPFVVWGISVRVSVSLLGHALVGFLAHNVGRRDWRLDGHAVQGFNVPGISLLTMGESWHNNHHAFPGSARLGLNGRQFDPGWWALVTLRALGLAWDLKQPGDLARRPELQQAHPLRRVGQTGS